MASLRNLLIVAIFLTGTFAVRNHVAFTANPIRRVVTMLQSMTAKITAEGERDAELFEKFNCYCTKGTASLELSIAEAEKKIPLVESSLEVLKAEKKQLELDLGKANADRDDATHSLNQAEVLREKEAAAFAKESGDDMTNVAALTKAINALETGAAGAFLQTAAASSLQKLTVDMDMSNTDRDIVSAFLSQGQGYAPQSGEIVGILKQMKDTIEANLADVLAAEKSSKENYESLVAAKLKETAANTNAIEAKLTRKGEVGVLIVNTAEDLEDTKKSLAEDEKFLADLEKNCKSRDAEYALVKKTRNEELLAIAETIKILNDDEALELFKKTLPSPSLLQTLVSTKGMKKSALAALAHFTKSRINVDTRVNLISLALGGRTANFDKIITMIDNLVTLLKDEQKVDDERKSWCEDQLDKAEDEHKVLDQTVADLETVIDDSEGMLDTLKEEIEALGKGIKELDQAVIEATESRKAEHDATIQLLTENGAAKDVLGVARNRLLKFYNKNLYKPAAKRELSEEDRIAVSFGGTAPPTEAPGGIAGTGVTVFGQVAPPPPPEAVPAYQSKGEESNGVMAMVDMVVADLDKEIQEAEVEEKNAQEEYETFMADSKTKRSEDAESIIQKEGVKAELEATVLKTTEEKDAKLREAMAKAEFIRDLHMQCDWLIQYFQMRKEARTGEVDSLKNAKAVLSGANYE